MIDFNIVDPDQLAADQGPHYLHTKDKPILIRKAHDWIDLKLEVQVNWSK